MATCYCRCAFAMMEQASTLQSSSRDIAPGTGAFRECANARQASAGNSTSGASWELGRRWSSLFLELSRTRLQQSAADFSLSRIRGDAFMAVPPSPIRILAVDDHPLLREGIAALIANQSDLSLVAEAATGHEAVEKYRSTRPDVTLMDLQMPEMSGIDAIIAIRSEFPAARIIVLTTYAGDVLAQRALKAGAQAYVLKGLVRKDLLETIRAVHRGLKRVQSDVAVQLA